MWQRAATSREKPEGTSSTSNHLPFPLPKGIWNRLDAERHTSGTHLPPALHRTPACATWDNAVSLLTGSARLTAAESTLGLRRPNGRLARHLGQGKGVPPPQRASTEMLMSHDGSSRARRKGGKAGPSGWDDKRAPRSEAEVACSHSEELAGTVRPRLPHLPVLLPAPWPPSRTCRLASSRFTPNRRASLPELRSSGQLLGKKP